MKLHRASSTPDWENAKTTELNYWQRLAKKSHGIITPGNSITIIGLVLGVVGLYQLGMKHYVLGLAFTIVGRLGDLLDGHVAEQTKTKGPVGELFDASVDKLITAATLVVLFTAHLAAWWVIVLLVVPQLCITILSFLAHNQAKALHPSRAGKLSMAVTWVIIGGYVLLRAMGAGQSYIATLDILAIFTSLSGFYALGGYYREFRANLQEKV